MHPKSLRQVRCGRTAFIGYEIIIGGVLIFGQENFLRQFFSGGVYIYNNNNTYYYSAYKYSDGLALKNHSAKHTATNPLVADSPRKRCKWREAGRK
jgi:hypothetical protein